MNMNRLPCLGCFLLLLRTSTLIAQGDYFDAASIQEFLNRNFEHQNAGMVIGIIDEHGRRVFAAGKLDNGTDQRVDGDTLFEIGSITKTFTVLLLEDMVARGQMRLDEPVANYLPPSVEVPAHDGKPIKLQNLAAQDSGLPFDANNMTPHDPRNRFAEYTADDLYAFLSGYKLPASPGAEFRYSNIGISLLGHAIERKTECEFEPLVTERICKPLHMQSTCVTVAPDAKLRLAIGHDEQGERQPQMVFQVVAPAGALRSTANDMLKYLSANLGFEASHLAPLMRRMQAIRHTDSPEMGRTAMPWYDQRAYQPPGSDFRGHGGGTYGFSTFIGFDLKNHRGVVVLSNAISSRSSAIGWRILQGASLKSLNTTAALPVTELVGIGTALAIDADSKSLQIFKIIPNSPAAEAGLASGLIIQQIGDVGTAGMSIEAARKLLGGPAGSKVRVVVVDPKSKLSRTVELTRKKFLIST
jgi:CubicO group peptidase (beta-lactamase class C family)